MIDEKPSSSNEDDSIIPITETFRRSKAALVYTSFAVIILLNSSSLGGHASWEVNLPFFHISMSYQVLSLSILFMLMYLYINYTRALSALKIKSSQLFFEKSGRELASAFDDLTKKMKIAVENSKFLEVDIRKIEEQFKTKAQNSQRSTSKVKLRINQIPNDFAAITSTIATDAKSDESFDLVNKIKELNDYISGKSDEFSQSLDFALEAREHIHSEMWNAIKVQAESMRGQDGIFQKEFVEILQASKQINNLHESIGKKERIYHYFLDVGIAKAIFLVALLQGILFALFANTTIFTD